MGWPGTFLTVRHEKKNRNLGFEHMAIVAGRRKDIGNTY